MTEDARELPAEVWLMTNGTLRGFGRLRAPMPQWTGSIVEVLPRLTSIEGWKRVWFLWVDERNWWQPTTASQVEVLAANLQLREPAP